MYLPSSPSPAPPDPPHTASSLKEDASLAKDAPAELAKDASAELAKDASAELAKDASTLLLTDKDDSLATYESEFGHVLEKVKHLRSQLQLLSLRPVDVHNVKELRKARELEWFSAHAAQTLFPSKGVHLYEHSLGRHDGTQRTVGGTIPNLHRARYDNINVRMGDSISSVYIEPHCKAELWEHTYLRGTKAGGRIVPKHLRFIEAGTYDEKGRAGMENYFGKHARNDDISSMRATCSQPIKRMLPP